MRLTSFCGLIILEFHSYSIPDTVGLAELCVAHCTKFGTMYKDGAMIVFFSDNIGDA